MNVYLSSAGLLTASSRIPATLAHTRTHRSRRSRPVSPSSGSITPCWWTPMAASSPAMAASWRPKLSVAEVPVIILRHLNQNQKRAFALADNKIALNAGWDEEMLRLELQALADQDLALALTG